MGSTINKLFETIDDIPENIKPCSSHLKQRAKSFKCTHLTTYVLARYVKHLLNKKVNFSMHIQVKEIDGTEDRTGPWEIAARDKS